jgi:hypothetical protein
MITKIIALLAVFSGLISISIATMIYGYGVQVKSWPALIGLGIVGQTVLQTVFRKMLKEK